VFVDPKECLLVVSRLEHLASDIGGKSHSERCCAVDEGEGVSGRLRAAQMAYRMLTTPVSSAWGNVAACSHRTVRWDSPRTHRPFGCETGMFDQRI
jgi:hypothetical protein